MLDEPDGLGAEALERVDAASGLQARLNALGQEGWEIASMAKLVVYRAGNDPEGRKTPAVARLDPPNVLLKRAATVCAGG